ncbi:MAG TPA: Piwi domain-containing protein [Chitinophagales bacterium]|nr:Piwi domain-containing protein [Chitinophagales bacterium]
MPQSIQLNIIPFIPVADKLTFAFYSDKQKDFTSIKWDKLFDEFPEDREKSKKYYYTDFLPAREDAILREINLNHAITFANHYFSHVIFNYFKAIDGAIVFPNYVNDVEVWFENKKSKNTTYKLYNKYTLKIQYNCVVEKSFEIMIAYNGTSKVLRKSIAQLPDFDTTKYNLINCNGTIYKFDKMPLEIRQDQTTLFPVLSNPLKKDFEIYEELKKENRFPIYLTLLREFCEKYIFVDAFKENFNLQSDSFYTLPINKIFKTKNNANKLQFRNGQHYNPGLGILTHKPLKSFTENHLKLFFIYNKEDGDFIKEHLYNTMIKGWKGIINEQTKEAEPLHIYINQPFSFDSTKQLAFTDNNKIFEQVKEQLDNFQAEPNVKYVAIYVTPISKDDKTHPQHNAYYKIKELLLNKEITSQVIYKEHIDKPNFYYFIPNIYIALLAKMGGIPWRLASTNEDELIVGVGAFKPQGYSHRFLGSAFCFSNEGVFENFDCFRDDEPIMLAGSIRNAVEIFKEKKKTAKRLIIHFYKEISDQTELQPILDMLDDLGEPEMPVIVVTINKTDSKELLGFDINSSGKMPMSGTYTSVGFNKFLIFNNTRYFENSNLLAKDYHFPIKLSFKSSKPDLLTIDVMRELINQVYQFSRMYWKSVSQQNLPVTTIYPEMVAEIYPHFTYDSLPDFGKENLWFL